MQEKHEEEQTPQRSTSVKAAELKPVPKSAVNEYQADVAQVVDVKSSIVTAKSNGSGASMQSRRSADMDQELIRKKLKTINSIKNRLQSQISHSSSTPNTESKRNTGQFVSQINSNSEEKMYGSNQEQSLGQIMKLTTEKQELKSQGGKQADQYANSGSFQGMSKGASDTKNPFALKNAYSPLNSQNQNDGTTITMDGIFKRSGGTSYDAQNETHNFPGNRTSRLVHTGSTVPIPTSATQAADIETMSSDIQMAEAVDLAAQPTQRTDRLTITDLAIISDPAHSDPTTRPPNPAAGSRPTPQLSKQDSLDSKAPLSNLSHISHISPAQLTSNMFSATHLEVRGAPETGNKQFTVHDYNRHFQVPQRDRKGHTNRERLANVSRGKYSESPNLGDTKFHHTDGTNTEQLTDLQNPLENLTQTQENDEFGHLVKKISSVRGSVTRTDLVRNSATRTEGNSDDRKRGETEQRSTPRGSRDSLLRNQMMTNQGQGQGQGGYNPYRGGNSAKGNSVQNRISQGGDHKPSNGTYSKISERSVSSLGQAFSNKESHHADADNILSSNQNIHGAGPEIHDSSNGSPEGKLAKNKAFKYPNDANQTQETRNVTMGIINNNVFKTPSARNFELTGGPCLEDINVLDSWPQSQPKFNQNIKLTPDNHQQMLEIGGRDIGTIKKMNEQRSSIEIQSVQTRDSQFIGQETCKNLFLNDALLSHGSNDQKWLNYQRKEDFTLPRSPQRPAPAGIHLATKPRENRDLLQTPKSKALAPSPNMSPHHQLLYYPSKYTTQAHYTATAAAKKSSNMPYRPSTKQYATDHAGPRQQRANTASTSPSKGYQQPSGQQLAGGQRSKKMVTTNFQKKNPPSFKSGIKAIKKFNKRSKGRAPNPGGATDDHIRVQLLKDRDDHYRRMQSQSSASRSSTSSGFFQPSIDTWSNESLEANKRHVWTYHNDHDNKFIQIFTPATELASRRPMQPARIHHQGPSRATPTISSFTPPTQKPAPPPAASGKPLPAFHLPLHLLPSPAISHRQAPGPALQSQAQHPNSDLDVLTSSAPPSSSSRMQQRQESARGGPALKTPEQLAPPSSHPASSRSKNTLPQQSQRSQQQATGSNSEMIDRIMAKNRQIIQEQKDILKSYQYNYQRLYDKYTNLKEVKYRQLKRERNQLRQQVESLEEMVREYKQQQLKASDLKILTPGRQRSSSGSRSRDRSPLALKLAVATGESRMSLQYKYDALAQKYQMLQEQLAGKKAGKKGRNETSNFNDQQHDFEHHNRLKVKLYDKINDLAWKYRSRLEAGKEEAANGRQLPVKDLWRWFKLMYRAWRQQPTGLSAQQPEADLKKAEDNQSNQSGRVQVPKSPEAAEIPPRQPSSKSPRQTPPGPSSPDPRKEGSKQKHLETQSPRSPQDPMVSSIQKVLCLKLKIDSSLSYQDKKNQIIERVEELQKLADAPPCQGYDKQEQLKKLCEHLQIEHGLDGIDDYIEKQEKLKEKKKVDGSMSEPRKNEHLKRSKYPAISIVQASLESLPAAQEQSQVQIQQSPRSGNNNVEDTITRVKLDNLESQLKDDLAFEPCWTNTNDPDSFLMNAQSNRYSKGSSHLLRESQLGKHSLPELSLIKDAESKDEPSSTLERGLLQSDHNPFQVSQAADAKERSSIPGAIGADDSSRNSSQKGGSDSQLAARPSQEQANDFSSVHLARISLESQIKEEEVEESRDDVDSSGRPRNRLSRVDGLSSFMAQSARGRGNTMDPRNSRPPSHSSFGSPTSRVASQVDEPNSSHANLPTGSPEILDPQQAQAP